MRGRTHLAAGTALALSLLDPPTIGLLACGTAAAGLGSLICDMDEGGSKARNGTAKAVALLVLAGTAALFAEHYLETGVVSPIVNRIPQGRTLTAVVGLAALAAFGVLTRHRSFLHSLPCMGLMTLCIWAISPVLAPYFAVGFGAHLALDLTGRQGLRLFYPLKKRFSAGLFKTGGPTDNLVFLVSCVAAVILIWTSRPVSALIAGMK